MEFNATKRVPVYPKPVPLVMLALVVPRQAWGFYPFTLPNYMMVGRVMKTFFQVDHLRCLHECYVNEQCLSYNFEPSTGRKGLCELNRCGVKDSGERETSLMYTQGVLFHQIRPSKSIVSNATILFMKGNKHKKVL